MRERLPKENKSLRQKLPPRPPALAPSGGRLRFGPGSQRGARGWSSALRRRREEKGGGGGGAKPKPKRPAALSLWRTRETSPRGPGWGHRTSRGWSGGGGAREGAAGRGAMPAPAPLDGAPDPPRADPGRAAEAEAPLRLKEWLVAQVESGRYRGLRWESRPQRLFRIPWKHAAKQDYRPPRDAALFKASKEDFMNLSQPPGKAFGATQKRQSLARPGSQMFP
ncbi:translation initiation factor IF-2-like [Sphaerodactylus townsendi]|uniref:translation initiation factor IF-2-like n=1 Tax=Sphaerodactylus townsendi TaxID=933632 RepID=UPI0020270FE2|nr:translation initiation factor IF-2-like [Sphaerodactylus townsendi]